VRSAPALRYRHKMKKSLSKLVLRSETIQALGGAELARVIGGANTDTAIVANASNRAASCLIAAIEQADNK
jgi:hypothetical protein